MNIYVYDDYRKFITDFGTSKKATGFTFAALADKVGIQRSYLTHVLKGRADLNSDQLYLIAQEFQLDSDTADYLLLLLEIERCSLSERKKKLTEKRDAAKAKHLRSEVYLGRRAQPVEDAALAEYYGNCFCPITHMLMTIPKFLKSPQLICEKLGIGSEELASILSTLERCRLIQAEPKGYRLISETLHVGPDTFLSRMNAAAFRQLAIEHQRRQRDKRDYFFTATISANEETRERIRGKFLEFLKWTSKEVEKAKADDVYQIGFDLFKVTM